MLKKNAKLTLTVSLAIMLSACSLVKYQPLETINKVDLSKGYRFENANKENQDDTFMVLMFSGGGTRAAALGYGVLEQLHQQQVQINGQKKSLLENVDLVVGVSGGSVLAAYYSLHGADTIPSFYRRFLRQNFQRKVIRQAFSATNIPRLASREFGRGDLLQEQFETYLFGSATFEDLEKRRKGPFAIISATDMGIGERLNFTQEYFDPMCLNLSKLSIARAVAASSAVPVVFAPLTLNNNGGNCNYTPPKRIQAAVQKDEGKNKQQNITRKEVKEHFLQYSDSQSRPYIHLLDGGLTDNLGMRSLLDMTEVYSSNMLVQQMSTHKIKRIMVINVNAQNQINSDLDKTAAVPGMRDVVNAIIDIPIGKYSQESLRRFRAFTDRWNEAQYKDANGNPISLTFVSLSLRDLPESPLRDTVLNIPTSFYLPGDDVDNLRTAAAELMRHSKEYQGLLKELSTQPNTEALFTQTEPEMEENPEMKPVENPFSIEELNKINATDSEDFELPPQP
ncbi:patatin-like phospholipase family protein [Neisseria brasiliensis]|uniref:patatin-like phospholipase family protein n=1 Tax=Neisseria TaxID=482 RepID=UPI000C27C609|nr:MULTISPECIES: patatin-like phospholipase family protein [Neisseria]PJO77965.1 patatin [Neisseria sp. N177_16]QGL26180.1 patatin-like phospholipase family protein [Neisseria brasiliensis]